MSSTYCTSLQEVRSLTSRSTQMHVEGKKEKIEHINEKEERADDDVELGNLEVCNLTAVSTTCSQQ